jgi:hypothetical protein
MSYNITSIVSSKAFIDQLLSQTAGLAVLVGEEYNLHEVRLLLIPLQYNHQGLRIG